MHTRYLPFYTQERWQNWINKAKESGFKLGDQKGGAVFVNMEDDVVLACLKIIARYDKKQLSKEEALKHLDEIKQIVLKKIQPINEDIDIMLESTQLSLMGAFASCECYLENAFEKTSIDKLIQKAIEAESKGDMNTALKNVAMIGANILAGENISEKFFDSIPDGIVAEWLDGVDSISAAMVGDNSYRDDEPDEE